MLKAGVKLKDLTPQAALALSIALDVYRAFGLKPVVTSGWRPDALLHTLGKAFDLRLPSRCGTHANLTPAQFDEAVTTAIRDALGGPRPGSEFDVLLERFRDPNNDHIHVEWDPRS